MLIKGDFSKATGIVFVSKLCSAVSDCKDISNEALGNGCSKSYPPSTTPGYKEGHHYPTFSCLGPRLHSTGSLYPWEAGFSAMPTPSFSSVLPVWSVLPWLSGTALVLGQEERQLCQPEPCMLTKAELPVRARGNEMLLLTASGDGGRYIYVAEQQHSAGTVNNRVTCWRVVWSP